MGSKGGDKDLPAELHPQREHPTFTPNSRGIGGYGGWGGFYWFALTP
jgi:hypothetical protein